MNVAAYFPSHGIEKTEHSSFPQIDARGWMNGHRIERHRILCECGWKSEESPTRSETAILASQLAQNMGAFMGQSLLNRGAISKREIRQHASQVAEMDGREFWNDTSQEAGKKHDKHAAASVIADRTKTHALVMAAMDDALVAADAFMEVPSTFTDELQRLDIDTLKDLAVCKYRLAHGTKNEFLYDRIARPGSRKHDLYCLFCRELLVGNLSAKNTKGVRPNYQTMTDAHTIRCGLLYLGGRTEHTAGPTVRRLPPDLLTPRTEDADA